MSLEQTGEGIARGAWRDERGTNLLDGGAPFYTTYRCADGEYIAVGALEPPFHEVLIARLGLDHEAFKDRLNPESWLRLRQILQQTFAQRTRREWPDLLEGTDACFAPVLALGEAAAYPHLAARGTIAAVDGVACPAPASRFSRTPSAQRRVQAEVHDAAAIARE